MHVDLHLFSNGNVKRRLYFGSILHYNEFEIHMAHIEHVNWYGLEAESTLQFMHSQRYVSA